MSQLEKEIELLKKISCFGSVTEEDVELGRLRWFLGKNAVVPLSRNYTHKSPFPPGNEYAAYILPIGISEKQAIESLDLRSVSPDQWLTVTLNEHCSIRQVIEKNLGITRCIIKFNRSFRMRQANLDDEF
jgi:hypothetical protein